MAAQNRSVTARLSVVPSPRDAEGAGWPLHDCRGSVWKVDSLGSLGYCFENYGRGGVVIEREYFRCGIDREFSGQRSFAFADSFRGQAQLDDGEVIVRGGAACRGLPQIVIGAQAPVCDQEDAFASVLSGKLGGVAQRIA